MKNLEITKTKPSQAPKTLKKAVTEKLHGIYLTDNYRWLEDKKDSEVIQWTRRQHDYTAQFLEENYSIPAGVKEEVSAILDREIVGPVRMVHDRQFFYKKQKGEAQFKLYSKINGQNKLIFNPMELDPQGHTSITDVAYTFDAKRAGIGVQSKGAEIATYYIINTETGEIIGKPIPSLSPYHGFVFTKDGEHAYITPRTKKMIDEQTPSKIYLHKIGAKHSDDEYLAGVQDAKYEVYAYDSKYSDISFLNYGDFYSVTIQIRRTGTQEDWQKIYESKDYTAYGYAEDNKLYFYTNYKAPNFKIMVADVAQPQFEHWKELYSEKETVLQNYVLSEKYLIVQIKKDALSHLEVYSKDGKERLQQLDLPELGNVNQITYHRPSDTIFVTITSFTSLAKIYKLNGQTLTWRLFFEKDLPIDTSNITSKQVFYTSKDGTKVPLFLAYRKDMQQNGNNPTLLYGYGGFNVGNSPTFLGTITSFVNRGGVYALACLRGGNEYGESWHKDGMLHKKQNTFDDFIAAAEYLIAEKYTCSSKLAIRGGSNGGLLIGAVTTQRPDLFKAAVCGVPLLDMVRYHKFLIARYWIPEYGDPDNEKDFKYILTYSPYHNIRQGVSLPTSLIIAGENDSRVDPLHAKKMVAALQNNEGQVNPILLYMEFDSGHGSGKSTEQSIKNSLATLRFIMGELGME